MVTLACSTAPDVSTTKRTTTVPCRPLDRSWLGYTGPGLPLRATTARSTAAGLYTPPAGVEAPGISGTLDASKPTLGSITVWLRSTKPGTGIRRTSIGGTGPVLGIDSPRGG